MIYLASPYSHSEASVRDQRFNEACNAAAGLMRAGYIVFSPIAHGHSIAKYGLPADWAYWERFDRAFLVRCGELLVLTLDGWRESIGVQAEIRIAVESEKTVRYLDPYHRLNRDPDPSHRGGYGLEFTESPQDRRWKIEEVARLPRDSAPVAE